MKKQTFISLRVIYTGRLSILSCGFVIEVFGTYVLDYYEWIIKLTASLHIRYSKNNSIMAAMLLLNRLYCWQMCWRIRWCLLLASHPTHHCLMQSEHWYTTAFIGCPSSTIKQGMYCTYSHTNVSCVSSSYM